MISVDFVIEFQRQLVAEYQLSAGMFREISRMEEMLADTYRNRVQYELLQNSDDAGAKNVFIDTTGDTHTWTNDGRPFSAADVEALCRSASSEKTRGENIGYRGIGFKSLASVASSIDVRSGGVGFSFDGERAAALIAEAGENVATSDLPLIRIPASVIPCEHISGARFDISPISPGHKVFSDIDPLSLLFLRSVQEVRVARPSGVTSLLVKRFDHSVEITCNGEVAVFDVFTDEIVGVAVPRNDYALSLTGLKGRLACFLPLNDRLGIPLVVSGDLLTDPSRTHAVLGDQTTIDVLDRAAHLVVDLLSDPTMSGFQRMWELLCMAEDLRTFVILGQSSPESVFLGGVSREAKRRTFPFKFSPFPLGDDDLRKLYPLGAPKSGSSELSVG